MSKSRLRKRIAAASPRLCAAQIKMRRPQTGFTLIELVITLTILSILTLGVIPLVKTSFKRQREQRLRAALAEMRTAIDEFHRDVIGGPCAPTMPNPQPYYDPRSRVAISDCTIFGVDNPDRYPPKLETLVEGVNVMPRGPAGAAGGGTSLKKKIYLRRIPVDPMTNVAEWDLRSCYDTAKASSWGGENVFDVRSKSTDTALNGEKYSEW